MSALVALNLCFIGTSYGTQETDKVEYVGLTKIKRVVENDGFIRSCIETEFLNRPDSLVIKLGAYVRSLTARYAYSRTSFDYRLDIDLEIVDPDSKEKISESLSCGMFSDSK